MPKKNSHVPAYRLHKASGQARVIINHEHIYLGKYGSVESREKYAQLITESASADSKLPTALKVVAPAVVISVNKAILAPEQANLSS